MADIFGYQARAPRSAFAAVDSTLTIAGTGNVEEYLVQNWQATYAQDISEVFEIGSDAMYWVKGRPNGQGSIQRLVGPRGGILFSEEAFQACTGGVTMDLTPGVGCNGSTAVTTVSLSGVVVTSVAATMNAPSAGSGTQSALNENFGFKFASMSIG